MKEIVLGRGRISRILKGCGGTFRGGLGVLGLLVVVGYTEAVVGGITHRFVGKVGCLTGSNAMLKLVMASL